MNYIYARYDMHDDELELWISCHGDLFDEYEAEEISRCKELDANFRQLSKREIKHNIITKLLSEYTKEELIEELNKQTFDSGK